MTRRSPRTLILAIMACLAAVPSALAGWVLPEADEDQMERLLADLDEVLPGGYQLASATIERDVLRAEYRSADDRSFLVMLTHRSNDEHAYALTDAFAVHLGSLPAVSVAPALERIVARIRANEDEWEWKQTSPEDPVYPIGGVILWGTLLLAGSLVIVRLLTRGSA